MWVCMCPLFSRPCRHHPGGNGVLAHGALLQENRVGFQVPSASHECLPIVSGSTCYL